MNYLDYIIAAFILIGFILGYKDGLVRKIIGLAGIILGIFLAVKLSARLGKFIAPALDNEAGLSEVIGGVMIFIMCVIAASIIKRLVHPHDKLNKFLNQLLGGITGTVQIVFFLSGFLLFLSIFSFPKSDDSKNSLLYNSVYSIMPETIDFMIGGNDFLKKGMKKQIGAPEEAEKPSKSVITDKGGSGEDNVKTLNAEKVSGKNSSGKNSSGKNSSGTAVHNIKSHKTETAQKSRNTVKKKTALKSSFQATGNSKEQRKNKDT